MDFPDSSDPKNELALKLSEWGPEAVETERPMTTRLVSEDGENSMRVEPICISKGVRPGMLKETSHGSCIFLKSKHFRPIWLGKSSAKFSGSGF